MALFKKRKKVTENQTEPIAPTPMDTNESSEQIQIDKARQTLNDVISEMKGINVGSTWQEAQKAAQDNDKIRTMNIDMLQKYREDNAENNQKAVKDLEKRIKLEEELNMFSDQLEEHKKIVEEVIQQMKNISASQARMTGADSTNPLLLDYIKKYKDAVATGQRKKAKIVVLLLQYSLEILNKKEPEGSTKEQIEKILKRRRQIVSEDFQILIDTCDKIYGNYQLLIHNDVDYEIKYKKYEEGMEYLDSIPEDKLKTIDTLGFKGVINKYQPGDPIRDMVDEVIRIRGIIAEMMIINLMRERFSAELNTLNDELDTLISKVKKDFIEQGTTHDPEKTLELFRKYMNQQLKEADDMLNLQHKIYEARAKLASDIEAVASNANLGIDAANSMTAIRNYRKLEEETKETYRQMAEYEASKEKIQNQEPEKNENSQKILISN